MEEMSVEEIKSRAVKGAFFLSLGSITVYTLSFLTNFFLTIFLLPSVFGIYFVVSAIIGFLVYFSDIGLAAALVQKKEAITDEDLETTFTIQQFLVITLVLIALIFSGKLASFYNLNTEGLWLFRALIIAFFLSSLKTISSILLERKLLFNRLMAVSILETAIYGIVIVALAFKGFGIFSFTYAVLARSILGLLAIFILSPWKIGFGFSRDVAKKLLSFGLPFQINSVLALIKDNLFTIFLGKVLLFNQVGYIGWAKSYAELPLRLVMDQIIRVTFPAYSRLQDRSDYLTKAIEKSIFYILLFVIPVSVSFIFIIKPLISIIPKYVKWEPAIFSFYLFTISAVFASISTPLTNILNAIGKVKLALKLMIIWTVLTWVITLPLIFKIGFNAVSVVAAGIGVTTVIIPIFLVKKFVRFNLVNNIFPPVLASIPMAIFFYFYASSIRNIFSLIFLLTLGAIIYFGVLFVVTK